MKEYWMDVRNYEGLYQVSDLGRVKSVSRTVRISEGWCGNKFRVLPERILKGGRVGAGYVSVALCKEGKIRCKYIHHIVWDAFNGDIPYGLEINHEDGDKSNNTLKNLTVMTHSQNIQHAFDMGLAKVGEATKSSKLTADKVRIIRKRLARGEIQRRIAEDMQVNPQTITWIKQGAIWKHVK